MQCSGLNLNYKIGTGFLTPAMVHTPPISQDGPTVTVGDNVSPEDANILLQQASSFIFQNSTSNNGGVPQGSDQEVNDYGNQIEGVELQLISTATYIYDGQFRSDPLIQILQAGQHVKVELKNMNILGVQLELQDQSLFTYEKNWLGITKKVYTGDSYFMTLLPGETRVFDFYLVIDVPINWQFQISTQISGAANVQIRFYSEWLPGMPNDSSDN